MFEESKNEYLVKICPTDDPELLEELLNEMASDSWELYSLHEVETEEGDYAYSLIFIRTVSGKDKPERALADAGDFNARMQKLLHSSSDLYKESKVVQRNIKEKSENIKKIKNLLDSSDTDINREDLNDKISEELDNLKKLKIKFSNLLSPVNMYSRIGQDTLSIVVSQELSELIDVQKNGDLLSESIKIREKLTNELGYIIPNVQFSISDKLNENEYEIRVRSFVALKNVAHIGYKMFLLGQSNIESVPDDAIEAIDPVIEQKVFWVEEDKTKNYWESGLIPAQVIANHLEFVASKYVDEILGYGEVLNYISVLGEENLFLADELLQSALSISDLRYILAGLIREKVSVKDIIYIFEKLNDLINFDYSKEDMLENLRCKLKKQICASLADEDNNIYAISIPDKFYEKIENNLLLNEDGLKQEDNSELDELIMYISKIIDNSSFDKERAVVISKPEFRKTLFYFLEQEFPEIVVISEKEIADEFSIEVLS